MYFYQLCRRRPGPAKRLLRRPGQSSCRPAIDIDDAFHAALRAWDQRALPRARRRPVPGHREPAGPRWSPTGSRRSPRRASCSSPARSSRRHHRDGDRPEPAAAAASADAWTAQASTSGQMPDLQGHDAQRRAQLRARRRLHQRLVDAEGRPASRVRLPAARLTWTATATRSDPRRRRPSGGPAPARPDSGYVQRGIATVPQAGLASPWVLHQNYLLDLLSSATARSTTARWCSPGGPLASSPTRPWLMPSDAGSTSSGSCIFSHRPSAPATPCTASHKTKP